MSQPGPQAPILDEPPRVDGITDYDRQHIATYLRLLDAETAGAHPDEVARIVLGLDPARDPERARRVHGAHLDRAHWMRDHGYRHLALDGHGP